MRLWRRTARTELAGDALPILFLGDSITFAWSDLLNRPGLVNRGVPGETTAEMLARLPRQIEESGAKGLHILGGVNDIAGNGGEVPLDRTRGHLRAMAEHGRVRGLRVWLGSVLPVHDIFWNPGVRDAHRSVSKLNRGLRTDTRGLGVGYIDYHRALADRAGWLRPAFGTDGVHLSPAGYACITTIARQALALDP